MNTKDAAVRRLKHGDIFEVYNDRAKVLCGLETTERVPQGICHSYESCADYVTLEDLEKCVGYFNCMLACKDEHANQQALDHMVPKDAEAARRAFDKSCQSHFSIDD